MELTVLGSDYFGRVALNLTRVKTTTQDVLPARGSEVLRRMESCAASGHDRRRAGYGGCIGRRRGWNRRTNSTLEIEYEYGRRVEEVIAAPGAVKRVTVGVIVPPRISEEQQRRIKEFVQVAAGIDEARGDLVSIQSLATTEHGSAEAADNTGANIRGDNELHRKCFNGARRANEFRSMEHGSLVQNDIDRNTFAVLLIGAAVGIALRGAARRPLSDQQRADLLQEIRRALGEDTRVTQMQSKQ